jgi:hypothetical protein
MYVLETLASLAMIFGFGCILYALPDGPTLPWYNIVAIIASVIGLIGSIVSLCIMIGIDIDAHS